MSSTIAFDQESDIEDTLYRAPENNRYCVGTFLGPYGSGPLRATAMRLAVSLGWRDRTPVDGRAVVRTLSGRVK
jgi:hypothetical protein